MGLVFGLRLPHRLVQEPAGWNLKRSSNLLQYQDGWIANPSFDTADVGTMQAALERKALLAEAPFRANILHIEADPPAYVHARRDLG